MQLWTVSKLGRLTPELRRKLKFYAPLTESLHFWGVDPVSFTRASASTATWRDGAAHDLAANVPRFEFNGELPLGIKLDTGETLEFSAQNGLDDAATLIWFEDGAPKSTPGDSNPFNNEGRWTGNLDVHVKHVIKAKGTLINADIAVIQQLLEDVVQVFPEPEPSPVQLEGFRFDTPTGTRNGSNVTFTLPNDADNTKPSFGLCFGGGIVRVASSPAEFEYTLSGTGNRTVTMGLGPTASYPFVIGYFVDS